LLVHGLEQSVSPQRLHLHAGRQPTMALESGVVPVSERHRRRGLIVCQEEQLSLPPTVQTMERTARAGRTNFLEAEEVSCHPQISPVQASHKSVHAAHTRLYPWLPFLVSHLTEVNETLFAASVPMKKEADTSVLPAHFENGGDKSGTR